MQDITMQDIIVVAAACVVAYFIGRYIKKKNERELAEEQAAAMQAQLDAESESEVEAETETVAESEPKAESETAE